MKTVIVAVLVLLVVGQSEALRCFCGGIHKCSSTIETCTAPNNACATIIVYGELPPRYSKGCTTLSFCSFINQPGIASATCCTTDLCNK